MMPVNFPWQRDGEGFYGQIILGNADLKNVKKFTQDFLELLVSVCIANSQEMGYWSRLPPSLRNLITNLFHVNAVWEMWYSAILISSYCGIPSGQY